MEKSTKWLILVTISISGFIVALEGNIVNIILPTLVKTFTTDFTKIKWVVLIYYLVVISLILPLGRMGDVIGKKKMYLNGIIVFTVGSLLCGLADSFLYLIIFRAIQGLGGAMLLALGFAVIAENFPPKEMGRALGIAATSASVALISGPVIGGFILEHFSWRFIFYLNIPLGIFSGFMILKYLKSDQIKNKNKNLFDIKSAISLIAFIFSLLTAFSNVGKAGFSIVTVALFSISTLSFIFFMIFELRSKNPIMDFNLFKNPTYSIGLISGITVFISLAGVFILLPFYFENILGFNSGKAGLLFSIIPIFMGICSPIAGIMADKFGSKKMTIIGLALLLAGFTAASGLNRSTTVFELLLRLLWIGSGIGFFMTPNNSTIMGAVPKERFGISSGVLALSRNLGHALGVAILGSFWTRKTNIILTTFTEDKLTAKMLALQSTFKITIIIITIILLINIYRLFKSRKSAPVKEHIEGAV